MRLIIQRVINASVVVGGKTVSKIDKGLLVLVGIQKNDTVKDSEFLLKKLLNIRLWADDSVSQFTLYATLKGTKPDFHNAMGSSQSKEFYANFVEMTKKAYKPDMIKDGEFGAMMEVNLVNDGPVTIPIDSRKFTYTEDSPSSASSTPSHERARPKQEPKPQEPSAEPEPADK